MAWPKAKRRTKRATGIGKMATSFVDRLVKGQILDRRRAYADGRSRTLIAAEGVLGNKKEDPIHDAKPQTPQAGS